MVSGWYGVVLAAAWTLGGAGCSTSEDGAAPARDWRCFEGSGSCHCEVLGPHQEIVGSGEVDACFDTSCCLLTQSGAGDADATCECPTGVDDCAAEAKSRRQTQVVSQCPPPGEGKAPLQCAGDGENCRQQYLDQNALSGCCAGSVCKVNSAAVPVCQGGTKAELDAAKECAKAQHEELGAVGVGLVSDTVSTSVGEITLPEPVAVHFGVGPAGCVNAMQVSLGADFECQVSIDVELVEGELKVTRLYGDFAGCPGFTGSGSDGSLAGESTLRSDVKVETLACDGGLIFESYCVGGTFDLHLHGSQGNVAFDDQHILLKGGNCSAEPEGECPVVP